MRAGADNTVRPSSHSETTLAAGSRKIADKTAGKYYRADSTETLKQIYDAIDKLERTKESFLDAVKKGAFTVPGDGSLDFEAIVKKLAGYGYEGWFVVEAEQDPKKAPPLKMAQIGHKELMRVMTAAGYTVVA